MDPRRVDDGRQTIDYPYDDFNDQEYQHRFSLHSVGGANPMMGESMDYNVYGDANREDMEMYYRQSEMQQRFMNSFRGNSNFPQDYPPGSNLYQRMDAIDDIHLEKDGGEENVDADEREGNKAYANRTESDINDDQEDYQDNQNSRSQPYVEERMKRLNINDKSQEEYDTKTLSDAQNILNNQQQMMIDRPEPRFVPRQSQPINDGYDDPYQQYEDYNQPTQENAGDDSSENSRNKMMIMQYESVLQSVNREFQKLLDKNKETEEELNIFKMKFEQLQRAYENEVNSNAINSANTASGRMNEEKRMQLLMIEKAEIDQENGHLRTQLNQKIEEVDRLHLKVMELEHESSQVSILKAKVDELMNKNFQKDQSTREKEETMLTLKRDVESLRSDIRNMEIIESTLKGEIEDLLDKRRSLEDINQNLKNQICECNIVIRQMASQFDAVKRENIALVSNIEIFRRSEEQLRLENSNLKELVNNIEAERIHYRAMCEQLTRELAYSRKEPPMQYNQMDNSIIKIKQSLDTGYPPSQYDDAGYSTPNNRELESYQYLIPKADLSGMTPTSSINDKERFQDAYKIPAQALIPQNKSQTNTPSRRSAAPENKVDRLYRENGKSPKKLPMHLASSVTFEYGDDFDQFYRKNQEVGFTGDDIKKMDQSDPSRRGKKGVQKAYFTSHLENVFDWNKESPSQKREEGMPMDPRIGGEYLRGPPQQISQGGQMYNEDPQMNVGIPAQNLTQNIPPKTQMNTLQKHAQIMKLENSLLTFQMDKDRLQAELEKIPESHRLSHSHQQRKDELQHELLLLDKNINTVKLKLREIKH